jgi:maltose O-acetyltransferase
MSEQRDRMVRGLSYRADDAVLVADRDLCADLLVSLNGMSNSRPDERRRILDELLGSLGADSHILSPFQCDYGWQISIGARCFINYGAVVLDPAAVTIGDDVQIGPSVQLLTATHPLDAEERASGWESARPITIGNGAWLGGGVVVIAGVTIGGGTVVGAGAVVTRDLPAGVLAVGNPARVVREL